MESYRFHESSSETPHALALALATYLHITHAPSDTVTALPEYRHTTQDLPRSFAFPSHIVQRFVSHVEREDSHGPEHPIARYNPDTKTVFVSREVSAPIADQAVAQIIIGLFNWSSYPDVVRYTHRAWGAAAHTQEAVLLTLQTAWTAPYALSRLDAELVQLVYSIMETDA